MVDKAFKIFVDSDKPKKFLREKQSVGITMHYQPNVTLEAMT